MKKVINGIVILFACFGVLSSVFLVLNGLLNREGEFSTYKEIENAGLIKQGWLPVYLPRSITNIRESHNLDSNQVRATFNYGQNDIQTIESTCRKIAENPKGKKYLCPPYETATITIILRSDGTGAYFSEQYGI